jgi:hypothetical protein
LDEEFFPFTFQGRSSTNPLTNTTVLSSVDLVQDLPGLLQGVLPTRALPSFIHEATHHWCFLSPVGQAITLLALRARRRAILNGIAMAQGQIRPYARDEVLDPAIRVEAFTELNRPLAEGLALFAEFDARPGTAEIISPVMTLVGRLFGRDRAAAAEDLLGPALRDLLSEVRHSRFLMKRKANVFASPLSCHGEGYLPGYLFVKNLWDTVVRRCGRLWDTDLFLNYTYMWIYGDLGLVATLLQPADSPTHAARDIGNYFARRLGTFSRADHESHLDVIERNWATWRPSSQGWEPGRWPNLATDPELGAHGGSLLESALEELDKAVDERVDPRVDRLAAIDFASFVQRGVIRVGTAFVRVRVNESGWTHVRTVDDRPLLAGHWEGWDTELAAEEGEGIVSAYANPQLGWTYAVLVSLHGRLAHLHISAGSDREGGEQDLAEFRLTASIADELDPEMRRFLSEALREDDWGALDLGFHVDTARQWADDYYCTRSFPRTPDALLEPALIAARDRGLVGILGEVSLVRTLAWLGLRWRDRDRAELEVDFERDRTALGATSTFVKAIELIDERTQATLGDQLIGISETHAIPRV